jgi:LuxR family maltose regulon positive regulatory protein
LNRLQQAVDTQPVTVVAAPAGYGKTTLLAALPVAFPHMKVAWLALDRHDNDPIQLVVGLASALRTLAGDCCDPVLSLFRAGDRPDPLDLAVQAQQIIGLIINQILEHLPNPFVLVWEDCHCLTDPTVQAALNHLLERLPPQMHLIISSRSAPPLALPRLRARGQLAEFGLADLTFSTEEMTAFFHEQLELELSSAELTALYRNTEGWPAGLRLLATSLEELSSPDERKARIANFVQNTDGIAQVHIFDYLAQEVLSRQSPAMRSFLLKTSILPELTPALCKAVTGWSDAPIMLEDLYAQNLFLLSVSEERRYHLGKPKRLKNGYHSRRPAPTGGHPTTYRYHDLFADFLRHRLKLELPEQVSELHRQAAEATPDPERKIDHYLAAQLWEPAASTIEQVGEALLYRGLLNRLTQWIEALPASIRQGHPQLLYLLGVCAWQKRELDTACDLLQQAQQRFEAAGNAVGQGQVLVNLTTCALLKADFEQLKQLVGEALTYPVSPVDQIQLIMNRAWLRFHQTNWSQAEADFAEAIAVAQTVNDRAGWRMLTIYLSPALAVLEKGLDCLEMICRQAKTFSPPPDDFWKISIDWQLTFSHWQRGRLDKVSQMAPDLLARSEQLGDTFRPDQADVLFMMGAVQAIRRNYDEAHQLFDQLFNRARLTPMAEPVIVGYLYAQARTYCWQGRLAEARQIGEQMSQLYREDRFSVGPVLLPMLQGLLAMAEQRYEAAERQLREAASLEPHIRISTLFGRAQLMLAQLYLTWNRPRQALAELTPILAECERNDTPGLILQEGEVMIPLLRLAARKSIHAPFAAKVLKLFGVADVPRAITVPDTGETLTPREVEVLELIATGATNRAIAEHLVISRDTAKTHVRHILRKLNVSNRTEATARARELGIV